ncbi:hypothetical protein [Pseudomonas silesiensis]
MIFYHAKSQKKIRISTLCERLDWAAGNTPVSEALFDAIELTERLPPCVR